MFNGNEYASVKKGKQMCLKKSLYKFAITINYTTVAIFNKYFSLS